MRIFVSFCIILLINKIQSKSKEYYKCINLNQGIYYTSTCTSIKIPEKDGYKCCSMKIKYNGRSSYNCLPIQNNLSQSIELLKEYASSNGLSSLFASQGGELEINCGENLTITEEYKNLSKEYFNCFNSYIDGANNLSDCHNNNIPAEDKGKCCYVETYQHKENNSFTHDKRCYILNDEYFSGKKNIGNFVLDLSNLKSLEELNNSNITVNCKNYPIFYYPKRSDNDPASEDRDIYSEENNSGLETWIIIIIVIASLLLISSISVFVYCKKKGKNLLTNKLNDIDSIMD